MKLQKDLQYSPLLSGQDDKGQGLCFSILGIESLHGKTTRQYMSAFDMALKRSELLPVY